MAVAEQDTLSTPTQAPGCPWWCTANHIAGLHLLEEERYKMRAHYGRERVLPDVVDEEGKSQTAGVALVQVDNLADGTRGPVGVASFCEGVLTPAQATKFASLILRAATEAQVANDNGPVGLQPTPDELRGC